MSMVLITALAIGASTVAGAAAGFLLKRIPHRFNDAVLGAAAGVMLGAAILGLIVPAAGLPLAGALPMTVGGALAGAFLISLLDRVIPHLHRLAGIDREKHPHNGSTGKVLLFVAAIALHKFPEGLAAGVSFGTDNPGDVWTVAGSIALQNIPEAMVIVAPLLAVGVSHLRTLGISVAIGAISMVGTAAGYGLISFAAPLLPFILALAGGAMLYVVSDEMIPETHAHGFEKAATFALIAGFLLILTIQQLLG